jgi:sarcosine oxidase gamma subunit
MANERSKTTVVNDPDASASGSPDQSEALEPDVAAAQAEEVKGQARAALAQAERDRIAQEQAKMVELQEQTQQPLGRVGGLAVTGDVSIRYLGPDDLFVFGTDDEGNRVAVRPGESAKVSAEMRDYVMTLPHDHFEIA